MENHIQGGIYDVDNNDYYISLNKETLNKIKEGNIIKSKIVYSACEDIKNRVQKNLFITLLSDEERGSRSETKLINSDERLIIKISERLLNILIEKNPQDYQHRYDMVGNKIHFLIDDSERPFNEKSGFDSTFQTCEELNKKEPTQGDIFESEYINVYKSREA